MRLKNGNNQKSKKSDEITLRISAPINQEELEFLEALSREAKFSGGAKLSRATILRGALRALKALKGFDIRGVKSEEELAERLIAYTRKAHGKK